MHSRQLDQYSSNEINQTDSKTNDDANYTTDLTNVDIDDECGNGTVDDRARLLKDNKHPLEYYIKQIKQWYN